MRDQSGAALLAGPRRRLINCLASAKGYQVMAAPPTVTTAAAQTIAGGQRIQWDDARSRSCAGMVNVSYLTGYGVPANVDNGFPAWNAGNRAYLAGGAVGHWIYTDSPLVEVDIYQSNGDGVVFWVDDQLVSANKTALDSSGTSKFVKLDFGGVAQPRKIRVEGVGGIFGGFIIPATYTAWPCSGHHPRVMLVGDSYTAGTGASSSWMSMVSRLGHYLGVDDMWASGLGSSGYVVGGLDNSPNVLGRMDHDIVGYSPEVVIMAMGINDGTNNLLASKSLETLQTIQRKVQGVELIVASPWRPRATTSASPAADAALKSAAAAVGALWIDTSDWMTGTGRVGAVAGNGNSDFYVSADSVHPSDAGHDYLARRLALSIRQSYGLLA
jgi:lysophospholipase L1-like esterase